MKWITNVSLGTLVFKYKCYAEKIVHNTTRRTFHKANTAEMKKELKKINWDDRFIDRDVDSMMTEFILVYNYLVLEHARVGAKCSDIMDAMPLDEETRDMIRIKTQKSRSQNEVEYEQLGAAD